LSLGKDKTETLDQTKQDNDDGDQKSDHINPGKKYGHFKGKADDDAGKNKEAEALEEIDQFIEQQRIEREAEEQARGTTKERTNTTISCSRISAGENSRRMYRSRT